METVIKIIEIFAFATGIAYLILEIMQHNFMWIIGIATGLACAFSFGVQHIWGQMGLNIYYVVISIIGLARWRRDAAALESSKGSNDSIIHLNHLKLKTLLISILLFLAGSSALIWLLRILGDSESAVDAVVVVMSAIGTWWLAQSYLQQWYIWLIADSALTAMCIHSGMWWMAGLYMAYAMSSVYGWFHWKRNGRYVDS